MTTTETMLIALIVILTVPYAIWRLGNTDRYAPLVVVQILAGIMLGPGVLGATFPESFRLIFSPDVTLSLNAIASWAVMLFVWIAGIELDLQEAWAERRDTATTAALALAAPLMFGCAAALAMLAHDSAWMGTEARSWQFVAGVGMACAVTALPILILLMEKLEILRRPLGKRVLRYASLDDIAIWAVLALILMDFERLGRQATFLLGFAVATLLMRRSLPRLPETDRWYIGIIWLAACGFAADWAGLHYMVGAFLSGAVLDARWFNQERMDLLRHHLLLVVMPVYFLMTGLRTDWAIGGLAVFAAAAVLLVAAIGGKLAGTWLAGRIMRWQKGDAAVIGWLLQTKALIMIIFINVLLDRDLISSETFTALLLMAVASTMLTVPVVGPKLAQRDETAGRMADAMRPAANASAGAKER